MLGDSARLNIVSTNLFRQKHGQWFAFHSSVNIYFKVERKTVWKFSTHSDTVDSGNFFKTKNHTNYVPGSFSFEAVSKRMCITPGQQIKWHGINGAAALEAVCNRLQESAECGVCQGWPRRSHSEAAITRADERAQKCCERVVGREDAGWAWARRWGTWLLLRLGRAGKGRDVSRPAWKVWDNLMAVTNE